MTSTSFDEYQRSALWTAFHPGELAVLYEAVGLSGEASEVLELALAQLDGAAVGPEIVAELGDVCWYAAALAARLGVPLSVVAGTDNIAACAAADVREHGDALVASAARLTVLCGRLLETVKKAARGDDGPRTLPLELSEARTEVVVALLGLVLAQVACTAELSGSNLTGACDANIAKLVRRRANGTLTGDGSAR